MQGAPGATQNHGARGREFIPNHCPGCLEGAVPSTCSTSFCLLNKLFSYTSLTQALFPCLPHPPSPLVFFRSPDSSVIRRPKADQAS